MGIPELLMLIEEKEMMVGRADFSSSGANQLEFMKVSDGSFSATQEDGVLPTWAPG